MANRLVDLDLGEVEGISRDELTEFYLSIYYDPKKFVRIYRKYKKSYNMSPNSLIGDGLGNIVPLLFMPTGGGEVQLLVLPVAEFLLREGADIHKTATILVDMPDGSYGEGIELEHADALINAAVRGCRDGVQWLLDHGANPAHTVTTGETAFELAVKNYNSLTTNPKYSFDSRIEAMVSVIRIFLTHPRVKEILGQQEINRIKAMITTPLNTAINARLQTTLNKTRYSKFRSTNLNKIKKSLGIVSLSKLNNAYKTEYLPPHLTKHLDTNTEGVLKGFLGKSTAKPVSGFKLPPTNTGFKHVNTSLFKGGKRTRKQKKRRNVRTRRS